MGKRGTAKGEESKMTGAEFETLMESFIIRLRVLGDTFPFTI